MESNLLCLGPSVWFGVENFTWELSVVCIRWGLKATLAWSLISVCWTGRSDVKEFDSISLKCPWIAWNANNWCYHSNSVELGVFMCLSSWRAEKSSTDMKCWFECQWIYFMSTTWDLWCNLNMIWWAEPPCGGLDWLFFFKSLFYEISVLESSFLSDLERRGRFLLQFSSEAAEGCKYLSVLILSLVVVCYLENWGTKWPKPALRMCFGIRVPVDLKIHSEIQIRVGSSEG